MPNELSRELQSYLKYCGLSEKKIARCKRETRMYHDLGIYGDIAEGYVEALADPYQVDLNGFEFDKFFPPEFAGKNLLISSLLSIIPFAGNIARLRGEYLPLTLGMIEDALMAKRWQVLDKGH